MITPGCVHVLHPGDVVCAHRGDRLETLLGSCVAIILTDPHRTVGAMCHIVHSTLTGASACDSTAHASNALKAMYGLLRTEGFVPGMCKAYVYGGGNMFPSLSMRCHVGQANARWALQTLLDDGVSVLDQDLGGNTYRRVGWTVGRDVPEVKAMLVPTPARMNA
jgi:chemotaxis protein CheD